jgi:hypothetical protein
MSIRDRLAAVGDAFGELRALGRDPAEIRFERVPPRRCWRARPSCSSAPTTIWA